MAGKRIGIYSGTFDPVHTGHVAFALQALELANLDRIYFLPERRPRHKKGVEHFGHRVAMLNRALLPHPKCAVLELDDVSFSVVRTLPKLFTKFKNDHLVFLVGSDVVTELPKWPGAKQLLEKTELVVGCRDNVEPAAVRDTVKNWVHQPKAYKIVPSYAPDISSRRIRDALNRRQPVRGVLKSVARYSDQNWLYISLAHSAVDKA